MPRIHRWSVMIYGSLQAEFTETKYNSHIHGYGTSVFCFTPCFINSCMGEVKVGVIYNTPLDSNEGDLSPHASQTIYYCNINENEISDRETPVKLLSLEPQYSTEPLLINSISIIRHSEASSCCSPFNDNFLLSSSEPSHVRTCIWATLIQIQSCTGLVGSVDWSWLVLYAHISGFCNQFSSSIQDVLQFGN